MKVAIPFFQGGGEGVSEEVETLGEAPPPFDYQGQSKTNAVFLFRDPPPLPEFLDPPLGPHILCELQTIKKMTK